ncbi:MAG: hypothetical protein ACHQQS_04320 [Thermoanaerobaculales bacterium]
MPPARLLLELLGAGAMAIVLLASGARVRRLLSLPLPPSLRLPVDFFMGSWLLGVCALMIGLAHLWTGAVLGGLVATLATVGRYRGVGWRWQSALAAGIAGLVVLPVALAPPFFYDALVYHLGLPWQALQEGGLFRHPEDLFAAFPPLAQLNYAPFLAIGLEKAPALLHWTGFVVAGAALWALGRTLGAPRWAASLGAGCLPLLPADVLVPALPAAESWGVGCIVAALAVIVRPRMTSHAAALAGFLAGVAASARLQGLAWSAIVVLCLIVRGVSPRGLIAAVAGWLAGCAPWWMKNLVLLGDPTAPLGWNREGVQTLWRDAGSVMHMAADAGSILRTTVIALAPHVSYLGLVLLASVFATVVRAQRRDRIVALAALAGLGAWALTGNLPRFLTCAVAVLLAMTAAAAGRSPAGRWVAILALAPTAALGLVDSAVQVQRLGGIGLIGESAASLRGRLSVNDPRPAFIAARTLAQRSRVLFVGEPRGFGFPRDFLAPSQHDVSPLRALLEDNPSPADAAKRLMDRGYTHLLINWGELGRLVRGYPVAPWRDTVGLARWRAFLHQLGPPVIASGAVEVFSLDGRVSSGLP